MRDFVFDFFLDDIEVIAATKCTCCLLLEVLANHAHQLFAIAQVDEPTANDVGAGEKSAIATTNGQHNDKHTFLAHVDTVFEHNFANNRATVVVHNAADWHTANLARTFVVEFNHVTRVTYKDVVARYTRLFFGESCVMYKHMEFTMIR